MSKSTTIKAKAAPRKTTLNLVVKEKKELRLERLVPAVLIILILATLFAKFAVVDRYAALNEAEKELSQEREHLNALVSSYADYDEVQKDYNRYTYEDFDRTVPNRQDILNLLEKYVFPVSGMRQLSIAGKSVSMTLTGMTLEEISSLIAKLENDPLVKKVMVSTTNHSGNENTDPIASMVISLADATSPEGGED